MIGWDLSLISRVIPDPFLPGDFAIWKGEVPAMQPAARHHYGHGQPELGARHKHVCKVPPVLPQSHSVDPPSSPAARSTLMAG